ncbi:hypothetical protein BST61_g10087 [Cercospora zeina]
MATRFGCIDSRKTINVSQDYTTSPAELIPDSQGVAVSSAAETLADEGGTQVVPESYEYSKSAQDLLTGQQPQGFDEYYDATPRKSSQTVPLKSAHLVQVQSAKAPDIDPSRTQAVQDTLSQTPVLSQVTRRSLAGLKFVAQAAVALARNPKQQQSGNASTQQQVCTSSDKSSASLVFSQTGSATSQTEAMTSAVKGTKLKAASTKAGGAFDRLQARRSAGGTHEEDNDGSGEKLGHDNGISDSLASADVKPAKPVATGKLNNAGGPVKPAANTRLPLDRVSGEGSVSTENATNTSTHADPQAVISRKRKSEAEMDTGTAVAEKRMKPSGIAQTAVKRESDTEPTPACNDAKTDDEFTLPVSSPRAGPSKHTCQRAGPRKTKKNPKPTSSYQPPQKPAARGANPASPTANTDGIGIGRNRQRQSLRLLEKEETSELRRARDSCEENSAQAEDPAEQELVVHAEDNEESSTGTKVTEVDGTNQPHTKIGDSLSKPGSTQENAMVLSDDGESSPPPEDAAAPNPEPKNVPSSHRAAPPRTPATVKSSPPKATSWDENDDNELFDLVARSTRKANIINFSKLGPRNQGVSKHKTPAGTSGNYSLPPLEARAAKEAPSSRHGQSSASPLKRADKRKKTALRAAASTQRDTRVAQPIKSSNVAHSVSQAMGELYAAQTLNSGVARAGNGYDSRREPPTVVAEQNATTTRTLQESDTIDQAPVAPSKSHVAASATVREPTRTSHNENTAAMDDDVQQYNQDYEGDTLVDCERSWQMKPNTNEARGADEDLLSRADSKADQFIDDPKEQVPTVTAETEPKEAPVESAKKTKLKRSAPAVTEPSERSKKQSKSAVLDTTAESPRAKVPITVSIVQDADRKQPRARSFASRPIRHISQGSQRVDANGSPVPQGMEMQDSTKAVMEVYSHREAEAGAKIKGQAHLTPGAEDIDGEIDVADGYIAPPSHEPERAHIMSSNTKRIPASPRADSTALTHFKASPALSRKMLEKRDSVGTLHDPFTKTMGLGRSAVARPMTNLQEILSRPPYQDLVRRRVKTVAAQDMFDPSSDDADSNGDSGVRLNTFSTTKHTVEAMVSRKPAELRSSPDQIRFEPWPMTFKAKLSPPAVAQPKNQLRLKQAATPCYDRSLAQNFGQQIDRFHGSASAVAEEEEDLEKILVAHEGALNKQFEEVHTMSRPAARLSKGRRSELQGLTGAEEWALSLQPRQLSLVNQMVECVQQLTQYMFEQERGTEHMLAEYHRRNLYLIEQEEKLQVKKYREMQRDLGLRKREKFAEAEAYHRGLTSRFADFERESNQHKRRRAGWRAANEELEAFIVNHS